MRWACGQENASAALFCTGCGITISAPQIHRQRASLARAAGDEAGYERWLRTAQQLFLDIGAQGRDEIAALVAAS